jgi:hypothetical protein
MTKKQVISMNTVVKTVTSEVIEKGAELAFESGDHTIDIAANAVEYAAEHVAGTVVDHTAAVALGHVAENTFNHYIIAPIAPARIAGAAVKDIIFSDKSSDEIGKTVEDSSFKAVFIVGIISAVVTNGITVIPLAIPAAYIVAKQVSPMYGGIARGVAWGVRGVAKIFK